MLEDSYADYYWATVRYIQRTLPERENESLFVNHVEDIAQYFHYAQEKAEINSQMYKTSFVNLHMSTYIVSRSTGANQISTNDLLVPALLNFANVEPVPEVLKSVTKNTLYHLKTTILL